MKTEKAIFAAGCFWGVQYYFDQVPGVVETEVGYIGGKVDNPSYEQVSTHTTGHAEAVRITYDPIKTIEGSNASTMQGAGEQRTEAYGDGTPKEQSQPATQQRAASAGGVGGSADKQAEAFRILLKHFFRLHDPTQLNRQGPDVGNQYRSAIFYLDEEQKEQAQKMLDLLSNSKKHDKPIATTLEPATKFWPAEDYHQKYTQKTGLGMCHIDYAPV